MRAVLRVGSFVTQTLRRFLGGRRGGTIGGIHRHTRAAQQAGHGLTTSAKTDHGKLAFAQRE